MKKLQFFLMIGALSMLMASCVKEDAEGISDASYNSFKINPPALTSDSKAYLDFTQDLSRILFENGDPFYVNGVKFTLSPSPNDGSWVANRADGISEKVMSDGGYFYCCHADGTVSDYNSTNHTYNVNIASNNTTTTGIVLAGKTNSNVVTLTPCFAVLVFQPKSPKTTSDYSSIRVGFAGNNVPNKFTVSAGSESISGQTQYFPAVSDNDPAGSSLLTMHDVYGSYFYIAIPIIGNSKSMRLYMEYNLANGSTVKHVTKNFVTLEKGKVYMLPDETRNGYAFDENGAGVGVFSVSATQQVNFSAGNLQCKPFALLSQPRNWRFAEHQYDYSDNNEHIDPAYNEWVDLLGYGTSGAQITGYSYANYLPGNKNGDDSYYCPVDIANTVADWGGNPNNTIKYGNKESNRTWRTLTASEWDYLINTRSSDLRGAATVNNVIGYVLLPDNWQLPESCTFTSNNANFSSNVYTIASWDKMEKAGAIFLPAIGYRTGSTITATNFGNYWTATSNKHVQFGGNQLFSSHPTIIESETSHFGRFIRLVSNVVNN